MAIYTLLFFILFFLTILLIKSGKWSKRKIIKRGQDKLPPEQSEQEQKHQKHQLLGTDEWLDLGAENVPLGFIEWDNQLHVKSWSKRAGEIFGWTKQEFIASQRNGFNQVYEEDLPRLTCIANQLLEGQIESNSVQHRNYTKDGRVIWCEWFNSVIRDEDDKVIAILSLVADVTERKIAEEQLQLSYQEVRHLASHLQEAREKERAYIAREIYEELGQQLSAFKMDMSWISKRLTQDEDLLSPGEDHPVRQKIQGTIGLLDTTIRTLRKIAAELYPSILDYLGLTAAIEWQSAEFEKSSGIITEFQMDGVTQEFCSPIAIGLFRICQEALTNVASHAAAKKVVVSLQGGENFISLLIADDGKGFDIDATGHKRSLGLLAMKERTLMMGGEFDIESGPGEGTRLWIKIPI
jgi:PAS domain S-box-containing protein